MALKNLKSWATKGSMLRASACGAGDGGEKPSACGSACGAGGKGDEKPSACGASGK